MTTGEKLEIVTDIPERAMVVFAHPDDAEIGSGGVVATWIAAGCEVTYVLCTNGDAGTADRSLTSAALAARRAEEQRAAADFMGVKHVAMLGYPDGFLEDTRAFLADVVRVLRQYRPHTVFVHDPYRIRNFQHRDHRKAGITTTDAIYPYARDHLHFRNRSRTRAWRRTRYASCGTGAPTSRTSSSTSPRGSSAGSPRSCVTRVSCRGSTSPPARRSARD